MAVLQPCLAHQIDFITCTVNFISLSEWMWRNCIFLVRQGWNAWMVSSSWENTLVSIENAGEMLAYIVKIIKKKKSMQVIYSAKCHPDL